MECLGCRIANGIEPGVQTVCENEHIACVLDIAPFNEGHLLILPKRHALDSEELDEAVLMEIMRASVRLSKLLKAEFGPDGITICQNGGVFNDLGHYHMPVIPRYRGDGFTWSEPVIAHHADRRLPETRERLARALEGQ